MKKKIMLVDGMALLFRGYFATAFRGNFMYTSTGVPTNGIYQFLRYFLNATETFKPTHVICCWDMGSKTFRTDLYGAYKGNRSDPPEELIPQFNLIKEVITAYDIPNIGLEHYEADDCIGTLAKQFGDDHDILVLTGDLDMLQLVNDKTRIAIMRKGLGNYEIYDHVNFYKKKGITPNQITEFKGLTGDSADNYPGVKGVGEKTALKLLQEYGNIDNLLIHINQLTKTMQTRISDNLDMLHLSKKLATIKCDLPINCQLETAFWNYDKGVVSTKLKELEFKNIQAFL